MDFAKAVLAFKHRDESLTYELSYMAILSHDLEAYDCYDTCYKRHFNRTVTNREAKIIGKRKMCIMYKRVAFWYFGNHHMKAKV